MLEKDKFKQQEVAAIRTWLAGESGGRRCSRAHFDSGGNLGDDLGDDLGDGGAHAGDRLDPPRAIPDHLEEKHTIALG